MVQPFAIFSVKQVIRAPEVFPAVLFILAWQVGGLLLMALYLTVVVTLGRYAVQDLTGLGVRSSMPSSGTCTWNSGKVLVD